MYPKLRRNRSLISKTFVGVPYSTPIQDFHICLLSCDDMILDPSMFLNILFMVALSVSGL